MTNKKEQSNLLVFTSAWPVLLWLPCSSVSVTLCFLNNGFQARYAASMCNVLLQIYGQTHYQSVPDPQAHPCTIANWPSQLWLVEETQEEWELQKKCNSQHWFLYFFIKNALFLILPRREKGTDYLSKLMLLGLFLLYLCNCYGRHLSYLQAETWTSLCT